MPVAVVVVLLVAVLITRDNAAERSDFSPLIGKAAPEIVGTTLDGQSFDLDQLRGRWVAVNFFATWCVPCQQEHPDLVSFDRRNSQSDDAPQLISVVFNDDIGAVRDFYAKHGGDYPVVNGDRGAWRSSIRSSESRTRTSSTRSASCAPASPRPLQNADELDNTIAALSAQLYGTTSTSS